MLRKASGLLAAWMSVPPLGANKLSGGAPVGGRARLRVAPVGGKTTSAVSGPKACSVATCFV